MFKYLLIGGAVVIVYKWLAKYLKELDTQKRDNSKINPTEGESRKSNLDIQDGEFEEIE